MCSFIIFFTELDTYFFLQYYQILKWTDEIIFA